MKGDDILKEMRVSLKACRVNSGLSPDDYAKEMNVTTKTIYNWESGQSEPSLSQLRKISDLSTIPIGSIVVSNNPQRVD